MTVIYATFGDAGAERACEVLGARIAIATGIGSIDLVRDPAVSPADLTAGLIKAHLLGAASAIFGAIKAGQLSTADGDRLAREAGRVIREAMEVMAS